MNILITAGGTSEKIDEVRHITNHATGRLGKIIADNFAERSDTQVTFVYGDNAALPIYEKITCIPITSVNDLLTTLTGLLKTQKFDAVIHTMAVSDYQPAQSFSEERLIETLSLDLSQADIDFTNSEDVAVQIKKSLDSLALQDSNQTKKISSAADKLYLTLDKTPKVIKEIKKLQPDTLLVGFKLLVDVPLSELHDVGYQLLKENNCQYVLANDLNQITETTHQGILIDEHGDYQTYHTKTEIARTLISDVIKKIGEGK